MKYALILLTVIFALFCRAFLVSIYKVPSQKMAPTIVAGDFIFASKAAYGIKFPWSQDEYFDANPERGDLVVFNKKSKIFIKRVIGIPQDEIEFINSEFSVNSFKCKYELLEKTENPLYSLFEEKCGELPAHKIIKSTDSAKSIQISKVKIAQMHIFVANDFRSIENDPDSAEMISFDQIIGKPMLVWMSFSTTQDFISKPLGVRWNRILTKLK